MKLAIKKNNLKRLSSEKAMSSKMTRLVAGGEPDLCPTVGNATCVVALNNSGCFTARDQDCPVEF
ncbi:hypothetical protein [Pseudoalteromonas luteoviolacea]|uniref:Uncharacterized protein n=1 Tax=Pseudoalteromonas luteoviolacea DSM 6061 TaxID=1365250 RepID=A0A166WJ21_9GAMM|nr:hypothetical protein [Pseudoalteromonas luteoviolacea]KZN37541.1 hypothetical protein N475_01640 [Pseudoalteromonas luteoviolacea DSM 6061]KZN49567.1 hypothetical protein N474_04730 [Pseudoalteromonas luteoviolacea CPMOR-2]TQF71898.1 hypothetical protein FLM44_12760 [Pseudoalteromonas luteoviolacea]